MRVYEKNDVVRGPDDRLYTVQDSMVTPHPVTPGKVKAVYRVVDDAGAVSTFSDGQVRNPPKA